METQDNKQDKGYIHEVNITTDTQPLLCYAETMTIMPQLDV